MSNALEDIEDEEDDFHLPRKQRQDDEMDITPMIDITFLLLIFFIVCSTMDPTKIGKIPEAQNGLAVYVEDSAVIFINPAMRSFFPNMTVPNSVQMKTLRRPRSSNTLLPR